MSEHNPWTTRGSRRIYENPWIRVREDDVLRPDGQPGTYSVVEAQKVATGVVALGPDLEVTLVGHCYPTRVYSWEIVEGGAEPDEDPLEAARRELAEEAGLVAEEWSVLGGPLQLSNCFTDEIGWLYAVARGLRAVPAAPEPTEVLQVRTLPLVEAVAWAEDGRIQDAMSVIGLLRVARRFL